MGAFLEVASGWNPDLGEASPRPPVEGRHPAPQTPLHKGWFVGCVARFALAAPVGCLLGGVTNELGLAALRGLNPPTPLKRGLRAGY
jgi:hypothetical protein